MSHPTASTSSSSSPSPLQLQMCQVTGCSEEVAEELLLLVGQDLAAAVDRFYSKQEEEVVRGRDNTGMAVNNELMFDQNVGQASSSGGVKRKAADVIILDDEEESLDFIFGSEDKPSKLSTDANDNLEDNGEIDPKFTEEEMMQQALEASAAEYQSKEPTPEANFQVLSQNYPHLDQAALSDLCQEYAGRSADLEKFVQLQIHNLPTKLDAEKSKLQNQIDEIKAAGVEGADQMIVEECPKCKIPRIIAEPAAKVFSCLDPACKGEFCRKCKMEQHIPYKCKGQLFDENVEFQVINILPKRMFDENDPLDKEFRIAEGQFLRMNSKTKNKYEITSIDVVNNRDLETKFEKKKKELAINGGDEGCLLLFHGTPQKNIELILKNNFDLSIRTNGRAYGDGVYFSECPEVSLGYSRDQKTLILCKVLMNSNCKEVKDAPTARKGDTRCWAVVVPDVNQILPKYVINFTGGRG